MGCLSGAAEALPMFRRIVGGLIPEVIVLDYLWQREGLAVNDGEEVTSES